MRLGLFLAVAALFGAWLLTPASAQGYRVPGVQPLDRILPEIRRTHPGQFYDAEGPTPGPGGSQHYHLKWMTPDGRVEWLDTDAHTGRVLGASPGRDNFDGPGQGRYFTPAPSFPAPGSGYDERFRGGERWQGGGDYRRGDGGGYRRDGGGGYGGGWRGHDRGR